MSNIEQKPIRFAVASLLTIAQFISCGASAAPKSVNVNFAGKYNVNNSSENVLSCSNNQGPTIEIKGGIKTLANLRANFKVTNNKMDTKSYTVIGQLALNLDLGTPTKNFDKQGSYDGVGGNPWFYFQYENDAPQNWISLGRCVQQGAGNIDRSDLSFINRTTMRISTSECSPQRTAITHQSINTADSGKGTIWAFNNNNNPQLTGSANGALGLGVTNVGDPQTANKSSGHNLAGGNPHMYIGFQHATKWDANGNPTDWANITDPNAPIYLGRCKDLMP